MSKYIRNTPPSEGMVKIGSRRKAIYAAICMLLPLLLLAAMELVLRAGGLGGIPPTFIEVDQAGVGPVVVTDNAGPVSFFFADPEKSGAMFSDAFHYSKPGGTVRVMLAGGSAIKGFPQPRVLNAGSFLEAMLEDVWPQREVEVINLGTTAVASFPVLEILKEGIRYEPDLVVIYCGHNEFFGAYGVSSIHRAGRSPQALWLQRRINGLALLQGLRAIRHAADGGGKTLMERIVEQEYIAPEDPLRGAAAGNLRRHIGAMINLCRDFAVPVLVCTLPSNEKDLAPLGRARLDTLDATDAAQLSDALEEAERRLADEPRAAATSLRRALAAEPSRAARHPLPAAGGTRAGRTDAGLNLQRVVSARSSTCCGVSTPSRSRGSGWGCPTCMVTGRTPAHTGQS